MSAFFTDMFSSNIIEILSVQKQTLSPLFLPNISYPSPTQNFYFEKGKNI